MIRLIAVAGFALAVATSAQAMRPAPIPQSDGMITQVRFGCGPGRTLVAGPRQNHHPPHPPSRPQVRPRSDLLSHEPVRTPGLDTQRREVGEETCSRGSYHLYRIAPVPA